MSLLHQPIFSHFSSEIFAPPIAPYDLVDSLRLAFEWADRAAAAVLPPLSV